MMFGVRQYRAAYLKGTLSPVEVVSDHLAYAERLSEELSAISEMSPTALDEAKESEARYRAGQPIGPLDGIPVVVKDSYHVEGMRRWHGSAMHDGNAPSSFSSEPILRLREAGAIIIAKTTMPDMGMLASGISSQFGIVRNPWDTTKSPGGSSSGAGASLAAGLGAFGLGTDIAGSVRLPSGHCGLAAIKPTQGRIAYSPASIMRSSGVMARSVSDVIEGLMIVGKHAATDPLSLPGAFEPTTFEAVLQRMPKVGLFLDAGYGEPVAPVVAEAVKAAAARLKEVGCVVEEVSLGLTDADFSNADLVFKAHAAAEVRSSRTPSAVLPLLADWLTDADQIPMADYEDAMCGLLATVAKVEDAIGGYDFVISPVIPVPGFDADTPGPGDEVEPLHHTQFTAWFNQTGQPAAVYREANDEESGLPIGVQIAARRFDDAGALAVAGYLEETRPAVPAYPTFEGVCDYE